jgi:Ca-activated chloride channel family protein
MSFFMKCPPAEIVEKVEDRANVCGLPRGEFTRSEISGEKMHHRGIRAGRRKSFRSSGLKYDQMRAPFVTWHTGETDHTVCSEALEKACVSAPSVHLIDWKCPETRFRVKKLDSLGMKYTHWILRLMALFLATSLGSGHLLAQAAYVSGAPSLTAASATSSTDDADEPQNALVTLHARVNEVNVLFIATDKRGKFVRDLNQADFNILDDHKPPQAILNFRRETDLPLHMGLLVDVSGSVDSRFEFEQEAATTFMQRTLRVGFDKAFLMGFNAHTQMAQDFTDNVTLLSAGVRKLHDGGGTALYDAIYHACKDKFLKDRPDHPVRKAIIVVSDGEDNQSEISKAQAIEMAQRAEVIIYAISTDDSGLVMRGDKVLEQLAEATGGRAFFPFKMKDITHSYAAIQDELRSQYVVSYKPADFDADGRYRSIEISSLKKDLQVRARKGYFAPQQ